jgi:hypothetical protein
MRIEIATNETLVEVYDLDLPITAGDAELLEAAAPLAPVSAGRRPNGEPFVMSRQLEELDAIAGALTAGRQAERAAREFVVGPASEGVSEYELAEKFGFDRATIRRWRGKDAKARTA